MRREEQTGAVTASSWEVFQETPGYGLRRLDGEDEPREQLNLTQNDVDYMWYSAAVPAGTVATDVRVSTQSGGLADACAVPEHLSRVREHVPNVLNLPSALSE